MNPLAVNLLFSTLIFWVAARIYLLPKLHASKPQTVVVPILLLHSFRHLGLMFLAPGATYAGIPSQFAYPAAFGDLLAAVLALAAVFVVTRNLRAAKALVWIFNLEGTLDLLVAIALATAYDASPYMGPAYWIPAFWVPALLVTHYITFLLLRKHWTGDHASSDGRIRSHLTNCSLKQVSTAIISGPFSNNSSNSNKREPWQGSCIGSYL